MVIGNRICLNISFSTEWLTSNLRNPESELDSNAKLVVSIFHTTVADGLNALWGMSRKHR